MEPQFFANYPMNKFYRFIILFHSAIVIISIILLCCGTLRMLNAVEVGTCAAGQQKPHLSKIVIALYNIKL